MTLLYIDPQSYDNLEIYDKSLLNQLPKDCNILYACSFLIKEGGMSCNIEALPLFKYNRKKGPAKVLSYCCSLFKILLLIQKRRPSVMHIQWLRMAFVDSWFYLLLRKIFRIKIVFTAHNLLPHDSGERYKGIYQKFYKRIDAIIVHDFNSKNELIEKFEIEFEKITVIKHGVLSFDLSEEKVEKEKKSILEEYGITPKQLVFSSLGIQGYYKGTDTLIKVWTNCTKLHDNPSCKLIIAGRCGVLDIESLEAFTNVIVENKYLSDERLMAFLKISDVILLPYRTISQSGVLLSAIGIKTPFLVSNIGGLAEPLLVADVGWKIEKCDEKMLETALIQLVESPQEVRNKKYDNALAWDMVKEAYSWEEIAKKTWALYCSILDNI